MSKENGSLFGFFRKAAGPVFSNDGEQVKPVTPTVNQPQPRNEFAFSGPYQAGEMTEEERRKFFPPKDSEVNEYEGGAL